MACPLAPQKEGATQSVEVRTNGRVVVVEEFWSPILMRACATPGVDGGGLSDELPDAQITQGPPAFMTEHVAWLDVAVEYRRASRDGAARRRGQGRGP